MKKSTKILAGILCLSVMGASVGAFAGCGEKREPINVSGSTSVNEIMAVLAGKYEESHAVRVNITANGSGAGVEDTIAGRNDFGMASRALSDDEKKEGIQEKELCTDGVVIVASKESSITKIDNDQAYNLFVNGTPFTEDGATMSAAAGRDSNSGTREAFDEKIKNPEDGVSIKKAKKAYKDGVAGELGSTGLVISAIESDTNHKTIGYVSYGSYLENTAKLKALDFKAYGASEYVGATQTTILNGTYTLQRPFMILTKTESTMSEAAKAFYDWLFTSEAQSIITSKGYVIK